MLFAIPEWFRDPQQFELANNLRAHDLFNIVLSMLLVTYLQMLASLYTRSRLTPVLFALAAFYATFVWHYARAQSYDLFQVVFFTAYAYHFIVALRKEKPDSRRPSLHLVLSQIWLMLLVLVKSLFFPLYAVVVGTLWLRWREPAHQRPGRAFFVGNASVVGMGGLITLLLHAWNSSVRFGAFWLSEPGAGAARPGIDGSMWVLSNYPLRFWDYFVAPDTNLWIHFPLLLFAIPAAGQFLNRHRWEYGFLSVNFLLILGVLGAFGSIGGWCYGPRYLLFALPSLSLPVVDLIDRSRRSMSWVNCVVLSAFVLICIMSCWLQVQKASRPFFLKHQLQGSFAVQHDPRVAQYFSWRPEGLVAMDFNRFAKGGLYAPLELALESVPEPQRAQRREDVRFRLKRAFPCNFAWEGICP